MKEIALCFFICFTLNISSQDKKYFDKNAGVTTDTSNAEYYELVFKDPSSKNKVVVKSYYLTDTLKSEVNYSNYKKRIQSGPLRKWYPNGKLQFEAFYLNSSLNGKLKTYWTNGTLKREDTYENGKLIEGKVFNMAGFPDPYYDFEVMPEYPGGTEACYKHINASIKYPRAALEGGESGTVRIEFAIEIDGSMTDFRVLKGISKELDDEAVRVIKTLQKWKPAYQDGKRIRCYHSLPVTFNII